MSLTGSQMDSTSTLTGTIVNSPQVLSPTINGGTAATLTAVQNSSGGAVLGYTTVNGSSTFSTNGGYLWTAPTGVLQVRVQVWGAGAGAGGGNSNAGGEGGGAGEYAEEPSYSVVPGQVYNVNVGQNGTGGGSGFAGSNGGLSSFNGSNGVVGNGGTAGSNFIGGAGGTGSSNTIHFDGGTGGSGVGFTGGDGGGSSGGPTSMGNDGFQATSSTGGSGGAAVGGGGAGGAGGNSAAAGVNGSGPGGAGGGAGAGSTGGTQQLHYDPISTASYYGAQVGGARRNNNGSMFQGCASGDLYTTGDQQSFANYNSSKMASDWSGWNVTAVSIAINNQHSWYNSGCYCVLGYVQSGSNHHNAINFWTDEGETTSHNVTSVFGSRVGSFTAIILGTSSSTSGGPTDLWNYGYYQGGAGQGGPRITVTGNQGAGGGAGGDGADGQIIITYGTSNSLVHSVSAISTTDSAGNAIPVGFQGSITAITPGSASPGPATTEGWHGLTAAGGSGLTLATGWTVDTDGRLRYKVTPENELLIDCFHLYGGTGGTQNVGAIVMATAFPSGYIPNNTVQFPVGTNQLAVPNNPNNAGAQGWVGSSGKLNVAGISNNLAKNYINFSQRIPLD
jgi:hypothetical protein